MEKNRYLGLMRTGTKTDMSTCLSAPTGRASVVKRATIVVHSVSHTSTYMKSHIPNIKEIDTVLDTYSQENILKALTHQRHGNDPWARVDGGSIPITKHDWSSGFLNN